MMQSANFHDAISVTAHAAIEDRLRMAAREAIMTEATIERRPRASLSMIDHLLVRFGTWLQATATQPATSKETVQC
jgi:hypothetical protein